MATIIHPDIGRVTGNDVGSATQFLGIKYGSLKDRFSEAYPTEYNGSGLDATKFGPQVISPPQGVNMELSFIQKRLPTPDFPGTSDTEGLNLNITVPSKAESITDTEGFPVLVFLHGGGFALGGGNWWPQYDGAGIVKLSQDIGKPIIAININYRVGAPGFLTSPELRAAGYKPNNGLRDQRVALAWIQRYIRGFGGDPQNITVAGESAGGVSAGYLLFSENPGARRLICLGGVPPLLGQLPLEVADKISQQAHELLGLGGVPASVVVQKLLELPADDLWKLIPPSLPLSPVIDGDIFSAPITLSTLEDQKATNLAGSLEIESILLGDSKLDASIMAFSGLFQRKEGIAAAFRASISKTLSHYPDAIEPILAHYSLDAASTSALNDDADLSNVLQFINDVAFSMPLVTLAANFTNVSYVLAFNEPNPWEGPFNGESSHILDVAFLFQNFNEHLSPEQREGAVALGTDVILFAAGEAPWPAFNKTRHGMGVYRNGTRKYVEPPTLEEIERDPFLLLFTEVSGNLRKDDLMQVFTDFMAARDR